MNPSEFFPSKNESRQLSLGLRVEQLILRLQNVLHRVQGPQLDLEMCWYGMMTLRSEFMKSRVAHWSFFGQMRTFALPPPSGEGHIYNQKIGQIGWEGATGLK